MATNNDFFKTDDLQWCRAFKSGNKEGFDFLEVRAVSDDAFVIFYDTIFPAEETEENILKCINPFGYDSIKVVKEKYPNDWNQIIAECLFEDRPTLISNLLGSVFSSEDLAEEFVECFLDSPLSQCHFARF